MKYLFGIIFISGIILEIFAIKEYSYCVNLLENGTKTNAIVVEMIEVDGDDGPTYKPIFEYIDDKGKYRRFTNNISTSPPAYEVGDTEEIVFNPNNYDEVKAISFTSLYLISLLLFIFGTVMIIMGIVFFVLKRKKNKSNENINAGYIK